MINMSYCRLQNTLASLSEAAEHMQDTDKNDLSREEQQAYSELVELCGYIAADFQD